MSDFKEIDVVIHESAGCQNVHIFATNEHLSLAKHFHCTKLYLIIVCCEKKKAIVEAMGESEILRRINKMELVSGDVGEGAHIMMEETDFEESNEGETGGTKIQVHTLH